MLTNKKRRMALAGILFVFSAVLFTIPGLILFFNVQDMIVEELGRNAKSVAVSIAEVIERDIDDYRALVEVEDYTLESWDQDYYDEMSAIFQHLKAQTGATYIYTEKWIDETTFAYVFDGEDPESDTFSPIGSLDIICEHELRVFQQQTIVSTPIEEYETWGYVLSGFAPIMDHATGETLGLVGVDYSLAYVSGLINTIRFILLITMTILTFLLTVLIYKMLDLRMEALNKDYLTGLYSKRYLEYILSKSIRDARVKNAPLSVLMLDVDYFKEINDKFGHYIGDVVLKEVANVISLSTRNLDICSRYGGDEFLVILPNTLPEEAAVIGNQIVKSIMKIQIVNQNLELSCSIGVAEWDRHAVMEDLIIQADKAMYVSKNTGKNKLTIYQ